MTPLTRRQFVMTTGLATTIGLAGCAGNGGNGSTPTEDGSMGDGTPTDSMDGGMNSPMDPDAAERAPIDRFSEDAGTLMVRSPDNDLPDADEPIDFDGGPFLTTGLGPDGNTVQYYNFDVQPVQPAPIYAFFREGAETPVDGQLNVIGSIPGDEGYNDFWQVNRVTVPEDYEANEVTRAATLMDGDFDIEATQTIKNCPVVPAGSTAEKRGGGADTELVQGWYDDRVVHYFLFEEAALETTGGGDVPTSPIFVSFNRNPDEENGGPQSGFTTETGSQQTHNVVATLPDDAGYSPLWSVNVFDNADFEAVSDLSSATDATILGSGVATVNCPIVAQPS